MLELARRLIKHARKREEQSIPIVLNLSSWKEKQSIYDWLVEQLNDIYKVPKKTAQSLIDTSQLLLLLDGLDEVKRDCQDDCAQAINQFRSEYGLISLVVCCRSREYAALETQLEFEGAVKLQPLTTNQIGKYFTRFGRRLSGLKELYKQDVVIQELAETPLMLNVMTLAYMDVSRRDIRQADNLETQREQISMLIWCACLNDQGVRKVSILAKPIPCIGSPGWRGR